MSGTDDDRVVDRVGKLLAQAEGTDNEHEAAAFVERAQQLATSYAVDLELARARQRDRQRGRTTEPLEQRRADVGPRGRRGNRHRVLLYVAVARANDVVVNVSTDSSWVLGFGHASDLAVVEQLWASLAVQMSAAAQRRLDAGEHRRERLAALSWRLSFYDGYVNEVAQRLAAARARAVAQAVERERTGPAPEAGAPSTELVLRGKTERVREFHDQHSAARGTWRGAAAGRTAVSRRAQDAGVQDGARADLGATRIRQRGRITA